MKKFKSPLPLFVLIFLILASCSNPITDVSAGNNARFALPPNAEIVSAELYLNGKIYPSGSTVTSATVELKRITAPWEEMVVNWENFNSAYDSVVLGSINVTDTGWYQFDIKNYIMGWQNGDYPHYGLLLDQVEDDSYINFKSREYSDPAYHPYIKLSFKIDGEVYEEDPEGLTADAYIWTNVLTYNGGGVNVLYTGNYNDREKLALLNFELEEKPGEIVGTGTPGYWKNHPEEWPVEELIIGGRVYSKRKAIFIMRLPIRSYKWFTMFKHVAAAKLNILSGTNPEPIEEILIQADRWLAKTSIRRSRAKYRAWRREGKYLAEMLDKYNNGLLPGAPSRDSIE